MYDRPCSWHFTDVIQISPLGTHRKLFKSTWEKSGAQGHCNSCLGEEMGQVQASHRAAHQELGPLHQATNNFLNKVEICFWALALNPVLLTTMLSLVLLSSFSLRGGGGSVWGETAVQETGKKFKHHKNKKCPSNPSVHFDLFRNSLYTGNRSVCTSMLLFLKITLLSRIQTFLTLRRYCRHLIFSLNDRPCAYSVLAQKTHFILFWGCTASLGVEN
jgi:hypothetical protein